jgi:hypothetical protein
MAGGINEYCEKQKALFTFELMPPMAGGINEYCEKQKTLFTFDEVLTKAGETMVLCFR